MNTKYVLLVSAVISTILSGAASVIPIWYYDQWTVSALFSTMFTPATFTFSIWSVIYVSWILLGIWQALNKIHISKENSYLLAAAQILSSLWLIPSQFLFIGTSLVIMLWVLYVLSLLFLNSRNESNIFKWVVDLFLWWIIVACIANIHLTLVSYGIYGTDIIPLILTVVSIFSWFAVNFFLIEKYHSYIPAFVLIWACIWIFYGQSNDIVQISSITVIIISILVIVKGVYRCKK